MPEIPPEKKTLNITKGCTRGAQQTFWLEDAQRKWTTFMMAAFHLSEPVWGLWCSACSLTDMPYLDTYETGDIIIDHTCAFPALTIQNVWKESIRMDLNHEACDLIVHRRHWNRRPLSSSNEADHQKRCIMICLIHFLLWSDLWTCELGKKYCIM